jgi:hypothetical protein
MPTPAALSMDKHLQILQLCFPLLTLKDVCMLRCTCCELRDMPITWQDHSIEHKLDGSFSSLSWLQNNIGSMRQLSLTVTTNMSRKVLQGLMANGR